MFLWYLSVWQSQVIKRSDFMKKNILVYLVIIFIVSLTATVFASSPGPEFKPFNAYFDNQNQLIVQGKWFNWSEHPAVVKNLKLNVTIWGNMGMNTYTLNYNNLEMHMNNDEVKKDTFTSKHVPLQRIDNWSINSDASSAILKF